MSQSTSAHFQTLDLMKAVEAEAAVTPVAFALLELKLAGSVVSEVGH